MSVAGSLLLHLLDWVRLHKADVDEKAREVLQSESPAEHHDYWDVVGAAHAHIHVFLKLTIANLWCRAPCEISVITLVCVCVVQVVSYVLQGRLDEARHMLVKQATLQPAARKMYKLMDNLLSKMPFYNVSYSFNVSSEWLIAGLLQFKHVGSLTERWWLSPLTSLSLAAPRRWQSSMWSGDTGMRRWTAACRTARLPATNTWRPSVRSVTSLCICSNLYMLLELPFSGICNVLCCISFL